MSINNPPVFSEPPEEPIIGTPADTFEPKFQAFMSWFLNTIPSEWAAKVTWLQSAFNSIGAELDARATAKFASLDQLDNEGLINSLISDNVVSSGGLNNLLEDCGTFSDLNAKASIYTQASLYFSVPNSIASVNGSVISHGGEFIHNNTDFGGIAGAQDSDVISLLEKCRPTPSSRRYGHSFNIASIVAGAGVAGVRTHDGVNYYRMCGRASAVSNTHTQAFWVLVKTGSVLVHATHLNEQKVTNAGAQSAAPTLLTNQDGWVHVRRSLTLSAGYYGSLFDMFANEGSEVKMALPILSNGLIPIKMLSHGQPHINRELS